MKDNQENRYSSRAEEPFMKTFSSKEEADLYNLKRDLEMNDMEKFRLFCQMLRRAHMFKRAKIYRNNTFIQ